MKWTMRFGAAALMLGISTSAPAGLFGGGLFSSHGGNSDNCCPQGCAAVENCHEGPVCTTGPSCEAPCEVGCTPTGAEHHKCSLFDKLRDAFKGGGGGLCDHGSDCTNSGYGEGCCPQGCVNNCHAGPVGRATVGGPVRRTAPAAAHTAPSPAPAKNAAPAPANKKAAPAPAKKMTPAPAKEKAPAPSKEAAPAAPAPPQPNSDASPDAESQAVPAPAPPEGAEAYFPSRYRR